MDIIIVAEDSGPATPEELRVNYSDLSENMAFAQIKKKAKYLRSLFHLDLHFCELYIIFWLLIGLRLFLKISLEIFLKKDMDYELWRELNYNINSIFYGAMNYFLKVDIDAYLDEIEQFTSQRGLYMQIRDFGFREQLKRLLQEHPNSYVVAIRGAGHLGMEEPLVL